MLMDISVSIDLSDDACHLFKLHRPADLPDRPRIGRLYADLQLDQSRSHLTDQRKFLLIQEISRHFKMKIRNPIVMLNQISPNLHRMSVLTVKRPVYKFHLRHFFIKEKL